MTGSRAQIGWEVYGNVDYRCALAREEHGLTHEVSDQWPVNAKEEITLVALCAMSSASGHDQAGVYLIDAGELLGVDGPCVVRLEIHGGTMAANAYARSAEQARLVMAHVREVLPRYQRTDADMAPVTFWAWTAHGPRRFRRDIDAPKWDEIADNYPAAIRHDLASMMADFTPGLGGQLILWHGVAGTGKTTAIRALAREWSAWADLHYIVDPEQLFGAQATYMLEVLLGEDEIPEGEPEEGGRWRVLILEDCGEMLQPDAKQEVGQALSRLLNACDGLIGRGLRFLVLVTTNEPLAKVHDAVSRPGRCAARLEFASFSRLASAEWMIEHGDHEFTPSGSMTLADLYAKLGRYGEVKERAPVGFSA